MKPILSIFLLGLLSVSAVFSGEKVEDKGESSVEKSSAYNPFTGTTTDTTVKKQKRKIKNGDEKVQAEDTTKVQRKTSSDGKKSSYTTEKTYTEERP
jgi:hypothetical protein